MTTIGSYAFANCSDLTTVTISNSVTSIGSYAFANCSKMASLVIPDYIINIGGNAFVGCEAIKYVKNESISLLCLWQNNIICYDINTHDRLYRPSIRTIKKTASSLWVKGDSVNHKVYQTSMFYLREIEGNSAFLTGLNPNKQYSVIYRIKKRLENGNIYTCEISEKISTAPLTLTTSQPKVISVGNVIVAAASNLDDEETNVGFEWRRTDWTDDFASNTGRAYLYEGTMEGYIRNLYTGAFWKYRPYYLSNSGTYYYGDWVGIDPTNTSYFEPTVHTYARINIEGNTALVRGYAQRGTDNVMVQGFMYWRQVNGAKEREDAQHRAPAIPKDAMTVEASGQVMEAQLTGLDYETTYCYVAFVKTSEGETFYGETQTFTTDVDVTSIESIAVDSSTTEPATVVARYNLNGQRITTPQRGVNILRMSDGTSRKVLVK